MSIRVKLLLLLLALALPPVVLLGWQSLARLDAMSQSVAISSRENMLGSSRDYMREKVADIAAQLQLTTLATTSYLHEQRKLMEAALAASPTRRHSILYSVENRLYPNPVSCNNGFVFFKVYGSKSKHSTQIFEAVISPM